MFKTKIKPILALILFLLTFSLCSDVVLGEVDTQQRQTKTSYFQPPPQESGDAHSNINITFDEESTKYSRETHIWDVQTDPGMELLRYNAFAHFTTHEDILFDFHLEFNTTHFEWNNNFTNFNNSFIVKDYRQEYLAIRHLSPIEVDLLDVGPEQFDVGNDTRFDPENPQNKISSFFINHQVIIRETTAFILALEEPFRFDLNNIQLGQIKDFQLHVFFEKELKIYNEYLTLSAVGSPFVEVSATKGLSGIIRLGEDYNPTEVHKLFRAFGSADQTIEMQFNLPKEQLLSYRLDYGEFEDQKDLFTSSIPITTRNTISFSFETNDWMPVGIIIDTSVPIWEQFSVTDYLSYAASATIGLIALLKGLPFYFRRRGIGGLRKKLYNAASINDWVAFDNVLNEGRDRQMNRKMSSDQYRSLISESDLLREQYSKTKEIE
ncbi:MAG: hypothetical protein ACXAEU_18825 [Candidatus Hodarchaeales archaeon]|jgi:hypothetical protein